MTHNINIYTDSSSVGGTGLFAATGIPSGELILRIPEPLITIPDDTHLVECCSRCMVWRPTRGGTSMLNSYEDKSLNYCAGCRVVKYCGKDCQRADWRGFHKVECAIFKKLHPRILPGSVRATIRILWTTPGESWAQIQALESHESEFRRSDRWEMISLMAKGAHEYSRTILGEEAVCGIYARLLINSITLVNPTFDPIGIAFDPLASLVNHSCDPNSVMVFDGRALSFRALREIAKNEEVTISYIDNTNPTSRRRSELQERYFFTCFCSKCKSTSIGSELNGPFIDSLGGPASNIEDDARAALATSSEEIVVKAIKSLHRAELWPLQRQPLPSLHQELIHSFYIPLSKWPQALLHSLLLYLYVDPVHYPQRHHPVRVTHAFTLASLFLQVSGGLDALEMVAPRLKGVDLDLGKIIWGLLCEVVANIALSHGTESKFAQIARRKKQEVGQDLSTNETTRVWVGKKIGDIGLEDELLKVRVLVDGLLEEMKG